MSEREDPIREVIGLMILGGRQDLADAVTRLRKVIAEIRELENLRALGSGWKTTPILNLLDCANYPAIAREMGVTNE